MKKRNKRILALLMAFALILQYSFSASFMSVYAEGEGGQVEVTQTESSASESKAASEPAPAPAAESPAPAPAAQETKTADPAPAEPAGSAESSGQEEAASSDSASDDAAPEEAAAEDGESPDAVAAEDPAADPEAEAVTEEEKEEEEEEVKYPAMDFTKSAAGMKVYISVPEDALPEGTTVDVTAVAAAEIEDAVKAEMGDNAEVVKAVDITFFDKDGNKIEPKKAVSVRFVSDEIKAAENPAVLHIKDNGAAEKADNGKVSGSTASFKSDDFSIYVVVEGDPDPDARLFVNFYEEDGTTLIATMSLTQNQITAGQTNVNIYDPGISLDAGEVFKGWTDKENYTVEDAEAGMDISGVRSKVVSELGTNLVEDGDEINLYAMVFKAYHVSYRDELAVTIHTDEVLFKEGDTSIPYTFQFAYTPYYVTGTDEDDETKAANFAGWKVMEPEVSPAPIYDNGAEINMADYAEGLEGTSLTLTVMAQVAYGHWLVFNGNGSGSSYTEPLFVATDKTPETAGMPAAPTRPGYSFAGWYTDAACSDGNEFDPSLPITATTNVWAKWTENTVASFTVLIWEESLSGGYDFVRSIEIENATTGDDMADAISGSVGASTITVDGKRVFIPMTDDASEVNAGFMYEKFDTNTEDGKVTSDGNSVLNIYFERRTYTLRFYYARSSGSGNRISYQVPQIRTADGTAESFNGTGGNWAGNGNTQPGSSYGGAGSESRGNYTYYYRTLTAEYGADISSKWPTYNGTDFATWNNYRQGSWAVMRNSGAYQNDRQGTIKGKITTMDEHILGDLSSETGNYVFANYDTASSQYEWTYHIYFKNESGEYERYEDVRALSHDSGSNWQTQQHPPAYPGMEEVRRQRVGNNREINYYYDPISYPILFKDGVYVNGDDHTIKNNNGNTLRKLQDDDAIPYKTDVSEYNSYDPTSVIPDGSDYVFLGWYTDDQCNTEYDFTTMPIGGITVYAKWVLKDYKVVLHPNNGYDESFKYINGKPAGKYTGENDYFWEDNGKKIGNVGGTRDLYDLIGWFTNENLSKVWDFDAFVLNDTIVSKYGRLYDAGEIDPKYPGTVGEVNLYASWRRILDGADGIDVIYTAEGKDGDGNPVSGSDAPTDPNKYSDQAQAIARPAAKAPEADPPLAFQYWVVQKWNGSEYVDTDQHVFPGDRFKVNYDDAKAEKHTPTADDSSTMHYTIQLRAQYGSAEDATPTHIYWYDNYTDSEAGIIQKNEPLAINQAVEIPAALTRTGYKFLGWAREAETNADKTEWHYTYSVTAADLFLTYNEDGTYTHVHGGETKTATGVFADENTPYDGMYAVWEPEKYTVIWKSQDGNETYETDENVPYDTAVSYDGTEPTKDADADYTYTFAGWATEENQESGTAEADLPTVSGDVTYYAAFSKTPKVKTVSVEVTGSNKEVTYNGQPQSNTDYTLEWFVDGASVGTTAPEGVSFTFSGAATGTDVGKYEADAKTGTITVAQGSSYTAGAVTASSDDPLMGMIKLEIKKASAKITVADVTITYGDTDPDFGTATVTVTGDAPVPQIPAADLKAHIGVSPAPEEGGRTYLNVLIPYHGSVPDWYNENYPNYDFSIEPGDLTIKAKEITVKIEGKNGTLTYNGTEQSVTGFDYTVEGAEKNNVTVALTEGAAAEAKGTDVKTEDDGKYMMGLTAASFTATSTSDNYVVKVLTDADVTDGWLEITPAEATITTGSDSKEYDGSALTNAEASISGLKGDDEGKVTVTATGTITDPGSTSNTYDIDWGDVKETNYKVTENLGTLTITEPTPTPPTPPTPEPEPEPEPTPPTPAPGGGGTPTVTPPAPVVPAAVIDDEPVPEVEPEEIPDEPAPLAPPEGTWALINLICAALTTVGAAIALFRKKEEEDEEDEEEAARKPEEEDEEEDKRGRKMTLAKVLGAAAAAASIITFILTEDMSLPMALVDKWTLLMAVLFAAQVGTAVANKKASELDDEEEEESAEA